MGLVEPGPQLSGQWRALRLPDGQASIGRPAADRRFDGIQRGDALQGFERQRRLGGRVHIEKLTLRMGPAGRFGHAAIVQPGISRVATRLQDAAERREMRPRVLSLAIGTVAIPHRRRCRARKRPVITRVAPQPPRLGLAAAGVEHRHCGVVRVHPLRRHHVRTDRLDQRPHQPRCLTDPVSQSRAVQVEAVPRVDPGLAIQRQMVAIFRH